jgi:transaldolase
MKFFLDTANLNEIREGVALGLVDGVTTNPSLVAKEGAVDFKRHVAAICEIVGGDVSLEVTSLDTEGMLREGRDYAAIAPNVVVKCPLTTDGLKATRKLTSEGIKVNVTLCFSASQAILAGPRKPALPTSARSWADSRTSDRVVSDSSPRSSGFTRTTTGRQKYSRRVFAIPFTSSKQRGSAQMSPRCHSR